MLSRRKFFAKSATFVGAGIGAIVLSDLKFDNSEPIKIGELAHDFRYEDSGSVCGLERVRQMCQNDAHLFVRPDQIKEEVGKVLKLIVEVYQKDFGFPASSFKYRLALRDKNNKEKYIDND